MSVKSISTYCFPEILSWVKQSKNYVNIDLKKKQHRFVYVNYRPHSKKCPCNGVGTFWMNDNNDND